MPEASRPELPVRLPIAIGAVGATLWIIGELIDLLAKHLGFANQIVGVGLMLVAFLPTLLVIAQGARGFVVGYVGATIAAGSYFTLGLINFFAPGASEMMATATTSPIFTVAGTAYLIGPSLVAVSMLVNGSQPRAIGLALVVVIGAIGVVFAFSLPLIWNGIANVVLCVVYLVAAGHCIRKGKLGSTNP